MKISNVFGRLSKRISLAAGHHNTFLLACMTLVIWAVMGPYYHYSDTWQLVINTGTTIITFLMVFLIQNTQNRESIATQIKLDEIIRALKDAHNSVLGLDNKTDEELEQMRKQYEQLAKDVTEQIKKGREVQGCPELPKVAQKK